MRTLLIIFILFSSTFAQNTVELTQQEKSYLQTHQSITYTGDPNWLPFEAFDKNGHYIGIVAEHLEYIEKTLGIRFDKQISKTWSNALEIAKKGKADVISGDISDTTLQQHFKPIDSYIQNPIVIVMKDSQSYIHSVEDIADKQIAIIKDYGYTSEIYKHHPDIDFIEVENIQEGLMFVETGEVDAMLASLALASYTITGMNFDNLAIVGASNIVMDVTLFVNKDKPLLHSILNKTMHSLPPKSHHDILAKWRNNSILTTEFAFTNIFNWKTLLFIFVLIFIFGYRHFILQRQTLALSQQKELYELVFENTLSSVLIIDIEENRFIDCNNQAIKILKYKVKDDVLNLHPFDLSPEFQPDGRLSKDKSDEMNALAVKNGSHVFEWQHKNKEDKLFWVEVILSPIVLNGKKVLHVVWKDIEDRKEKEKEITDKNKKFEESQRIAHIGSWEFNITQRTLIWSKEMYNILELPSDAKANYHSLLKTIHPSDRRAAKRAYSNSLKNQVPFDITHRLLMDDGRIKFVREQCETSFDKNGNPLISFGTLQDVTEVAKISQQLDYAISGTNDGLWDWDMTEEDFIYFSPRFKEMVGFKDDEFKNSYLAWEARIHPDDLSETLSSIERAIENPKLPYKSVHRFKHKDGHWVWILDRARVILDDKNKPIRMVGFYTDITELKNKEKKIEELSTLLSNTLNSVENVIFVKDKDFRYIECNPSFERLAGISRDEIIGKDDYDIWDKEVADYFRKHDTLMFESGTTQQNYEWVTYPDEKQAYLLTSKTPLRDSDGEILGLVGNSVDVTKEHNTQREISKLKSALDRSPISIMMTDKNANIEYVNPHYCEISGYSLAELLNKNPRIVKSGYTSDKQYKKMWEAISSGEVWSSDIKNIAKDGSEFWETSTILPTTDIDGKVDGYIAFKLDITEKIHMENELKLNEELMIAQSRHAAMGEMISMIAHQWRQPITVIAMGANNMLVDIELDDIKKENFKLESETILEQTKYLSKTIDDFRNFFRPNKEKEEIKVINVLEEAKVIFEKSLEHNNITLSIKDHGTKPIKLYARELLQVIINLIKNSKEALIDHQTDKRHIDIEIKENHENIIISVLDNGGGIKEENLNKIFDPYFSTKDKKTGTGLGLYMSKTIIDKHLNGKLYADNKDGGACFTIILPIR